MEREFSELQKEFQVKYLEILKKHMINGLAIIENMSILDEKYKDAIINLNNINNIALQINYDLTEKEKETVEAEPTE